jgi:hypothetical protein
MIEEIENLKQQQLQELQILKEKSLELQNLKK